MKTKVTMQNHEITTARIRDSFAAKLNAHPEIAETEFNLSWSNWGFGLESLSDSAARLARHGVSWIELHGNHYGPNLGYRAAETQTILADHGIKCAGICGMFSRENDLSSNSGVSRQHAIDYIKRTLNFAVEVQANYMLVVPGAVGRPTKYDDSEFHRSVETLRLVADQFKQANVKAAIEPIRAAEVSFCHTVEEAKVYIKAVDHPAVAHINADLYHMQVGEEHIGSALLDAGSALINLHTADSNRCALGKGSLDLDTIIRALFLLNFNQAGHYFTPEPLGPGGDPYPAMNGRPNPAQLEELVRQTVEYFRNRVAAVLEAG